MSAAERIRNIQVHRPIIYGSHARLLSEAEKQLAPAGHTHRWTVFITSATTPPPPVASSSTQPPPVDMDYIPGGEDDLSYLIKKVTFRLHETYANPNRVCDKPPFQVSETGWGEFTVQIRLQFVQESGEKPLTLAHPIKLHHWGPPIEAPPPRPPHPSGTATAGVEGGESTNATSSPAPEGGTDAVKTEVTTPAAANPDTPAEGMQGTPKVEDSQTSQTEAQAQALSISTKYPVHAWQYDEIVFADPLPNFLSILNQHTPTPLPPKNRRPRDQREDNELKSGPKKKAKPRASVSMSRDVTAEPTLPQTPGGAGSTPAPLTPAAVPPGGGMAGIHGEPGSADVPLEYSVEMEKAEWNRLNDVRIKIVEQMDKWRERLIGQEKELTKLKEEMGLA